jgi:hypothetical protein
VTIAIHVPPEWVPHLQRKGIRSHRPEHSLLPADGAPIQVERRPL